MAETGAAIAGTSLAVTSSLNIRKKYKTTPLACNEVINAHKTLKDRTDRYARYHHEHRGEYHRRSDASATKAEADSREILRAEEPWVEESRDLLETINDKKGRWGGRAWERLSYDQYRAKESIKKQENAAAHLEHSHVQHTRQVAARESERKAEVRKKKQERSLRTVDQWDDGEIGEHTSTLGEVPSLYSGATTIDDDEDLHEQQHNIPYSQPGYYTESKPHHGTSYDGYDNQYEQQRLDEWPAYENKQEQEWPGYTYQQNRYSPQADYYRYRY